MSITDRYWKYILTNGKTHIIVSILPLFFSVIFLFLFLTQNAAFSLGTDDVPTGTKERSGRPPVIMVIFDEFCLTSLMDKDRQIDSSRYPNFALLARDAYWFRNATTVADFTIFAVPAILTGSYPGGALLPTADNYPRNIFSLLVNSYEINEFEMYSMLCPEEVCGTKKDTYKKIHTKEGFRKAHEERFKKHKAKDRLDFFFRFVESLKPADKPTFHFLHTSLPHIPFEYLPSGKKYYVPPQWINRREAMVKAGSGHWGDNEWLINQAYQQYLLQAGATDTFFGRLIDRLKQTGLYDRSLIIVTSDHGLSFIPGDYSRRLTKKSFKDIMPVPLFIKLPYQHKGVVSDRNVETIDILPTIAGILDIKLPWQVDGQSMLDTSAAERSGKIIFHTQQHPRKDDANKRYEKFVFGPAIDEKYETLEKKIALFGSGTGWPALFRIGHYNELINESINEVDIAGKADVVVKINREDNYSALDPEKEPLLNFITGQIVADKATAEFNLAVSVNGVIQAVTRTYTKKGMIKFSALVPEHALKAGKNKIEVFVVNAGSEGHPQLFRTN
jgi:hypothetical protein